MSTAMPKVLAATLTWNEHVQTRKALESLLQQDYPNCVVCIVDNGSNDPEVKNLRVGFSNVAWVRHRENFGYGEGVNGQIRHALEIGADYLLSIDNDGTIEPGALEKMVAAAGQDESIGVVFPEVQEACTQQGRQRQMRKDTTGGFFLVRMAAVKKAGYFNPRYFIYQDDAEWFQRIYKAGYKACFVPEARCWHAGAAVFGVGSRAYGYYQKRNALQFCKERGGWVLLYTRLFIYGFLFFWIDAFRAALGAPSAKGRIEGALDFLRGKRGPKDFSTAQPGLFRRLQRFWANRLGLAGIRSKKQRTVAEGAPMRIQVNLDWNIGDEIMASPVLELLKLKHPLAKIDVLSRHPALFENHRFADSVNQGKAFKADCFIDLHQEIRHRKRSDYMAELAGVSGWAEVKIYLRAEELDAAKRRWQLDAGQLRIVICPEVWWLARRWPRERWIQLASQLEAKRHAKIFILGQEDTAFPVGINLVGKTSLRESCALIQQCDLFIGHDSGPLYMALAVGTPSVGLYGPLNPDLLYPERPGFKAVWTEVPCRGCWPESRMVYRDHCPKVVPDCMTSMPYERVYAAVEELLR